MWDWMHGGWWGFGMWGMGLFWLVLVALLVLLAVRVMGDRSPVREPPGREETPLEILDRRYARGEIDRAEYEERRRGIHGDESGR